MNRRAFTVLEIVVAVAALALIAAVIFPILFRTRESKRPNPCPSNLKQIGLGLKQYVQDYDEKFPPAKGMKGQRWAELFMPYIKSQQIFQCPSEPTAPTKSFTTDYFFNARLFEMEEKDILEPRVTISSGDGEQSPNASLRYLPPDWLPSTRHLEGANYGFADGHVKWLKPEAVTTRKPSADVWTFRVR